MKRVCLILFIICSLSIEFIYGQNDLMVKELPTQYKTNEDYVRRFYIDSSGMVWMRTHSRMLRYTGNEINSFDNILPPDFDLKDAYMLGYKILLNYNYKKLKIFNIKNLDVTEVAMPIENAEPSYIAIKDEKNIYISFAKQHKVIICELRGNSLKILHEVNDIFCETIIPCTNNCFLFSVDLAIFYFNAKTNKYNKILRRVKISDYLLKDSTLIIVTNYKVTFIDIANGSIRKELILKNPTEAISNISFIENRLWLFSNINTYYFNNGYSVLEKYSFNNYTKNEMLNASVFDIFKVSAEGYYLISTLSGVYKSKCVSYNALSSIDLGDFFSQTERLNFRCIYHSETTKDIITSIDLNGIYILKSSMKKINNCIPFDNSKNQTCNLNKIASDKNGGIWLIGNVGIRIKKPDKIDSILLIRSWDIYFAKENSWLIQNYYNYSSLKLLDSNNKILKTFIYNSTDNEPISFWDIEPYKNYLFISSVDGIITFDTEKEQYVDTKSVLRTNEDLKGRAGSSKVISNYLYVAYQDKGVKKVNLKTGEVSNPLPGITKAFQIESCDGKNLWINAQDKLIYLKEDGTYFILKTNDFPLPSEIAFHGMYAESNGDLWVCGKGGFTKINTGELLQNIANTQVQTILCGLSVNSQLVAGNLPSRSTLTLPFDSNTISLDIANNLLDNARDIKMKYQLQGYDRAYSETENTNNITYKNLPYGYYTLEIFVCNSLGIWDQTPTLLFIEIRPPWYYSVLAKFIYALIVIGILFGIYYLIRRRFEQQKQQELMLAESELKGIRSQLNPHFVFNSLNSIQSHILNKNNEIASTYLNKFAKLMRRVLDYSTSESISLINEIEWIQDYFELEALRFEDKFQWHIHCDDAIDTNIHIPALVIQPVIENAIIHGLFPKKTAGNIYLSYQLNPDNKSITCQVRDDGVGRGQALSPFHSTHTSKGMLITQQRLQYLSRKYNIQSSITITDLRNDDGEPTGTLVTIILPLISKPSIKNTAFEN